MEVLPALSGFKWKIRRANKIRFSITFNDRNKIVFRHLYEEELSLCVFYNKGRESDVNVRGRLGTCGGIPSWIRWFRNILNLSWSTSMKLSRKLSVFAYLRDDLLVFQFFVFRVHDLSLHGRFSTCSVSLMGQGSSVSIKLTHCKCLVLNPRPQEALHSLQLLHSMPEIYWKKRRYFFHSSSKLKNKTGIRLPNIGPSPLFPSFSSSSSLVASKWSSDSLNVSTIWAEFTLWNKEHK